MTGLLPVSDFEWLTQSEIDQIDLTGKSWDLEGTKGYVFICKVTYPKEVSSL